MDIWAYHLHENENHTNKKWFVRNRSLLTLEFVKNMIFLYSSATRQTYKYSKTKKILCLTKYTSRMSCNLMVHFWFVVCTLSEELFLSSMLSLQMRRKGILSSAKNLISF